MKNKLGKIIKKYKIENGISTRQLSMRTNEISESYWNELIRGEKRNGKEISPSINTLQVVAKSMDKTLEELLFEMGEISSTPKTKIKLAEAVQIVESINDICKTAHLPISFSVDELTDIQIMELAERVMQDLEVYAYKFK